MFLLMTKEIKHEIHADIHEFRMDNEYLGYAKIKRFLDERGTIYENAIPGTHHMNGTAERGFRTERDKAATMMQEQSSIAKRVFNILDARTKEILAQTSIPEKLWHLAFRHAVWLKNRSPTRALALRKTPWEALTTYKPNLSKESIFGSRLYITMEPKKRRKSLLQTRGRLAYFVGFETEAVMFAYDDDKDEVVRVTAARVDHGNGVFDPHNGDSFQDRVPYHSLADVSDINSGSMSDVDADLDDQTNGDVHYNSGPLPIESDSEDLYNLSDDAMPPVTRSKSVAQGDATPSTPPQVAPSVTSEAAPLSSAPSVTRDSDDESDQTPVLSKYFTKKKAKSAVAKEPWLTEDRAILLHELSQDPRFETWDHKATLFAKVFEPRTRGDIKTASDRLSKLVETDNIPESWTDFDSPSERTAMRVRINDTLAKGIGRSQRTTNWKANFHNVASKYTVNQAICLVLLLEDTTIVSDTARFTIFLTIHSATVCGSTQTMSKHGNAIREASKEELLAAWPEFFDVDRRQVTSKLISDLNVQAGSQGWSEMEYIFLDHLTFGNLDLNERARAELFRQFTRAYATRLDVNVPYHSTLRVRES